MPGEAALTPMFRQYRTMKAEHPGAILLFRMGDFYEMFYEDAQDASRILDLALTARGKGTAHAAPMCGFPHHQIGPYTAKLVRAGRSVAVCDQMEDPRKAKGLVRREVVRIVTPGTITDPVEIDEREPVWVAAVATCDGRVGAAFLDASTGDFLAWQSDATGPAAWEAFADRFGAFAPRECVHPEDLAWPDATKRDLAARAALNAYDPFAFLVATAGSFLEKHFAVASLDGFGLRGRPAATAAAGGLLAYLRDTQRSGLQHVDGLRLHEPATRLLLDPATRRNLEIDRNARDGSRTGTLIESVDVTVTSPGARLLRSWILEPLLEPAAIAERLDAVEELVERGDLRADLRERLAAVRDVERLAGRCVAGTASARDLVALRGSLDGLPELGSALASAAMPLTRRLLDRLDPCADVASRLAAAIVDEPPAGLKEGGLIRDGFDPELDDLRSIRRDGRAYIAGLETREKDATGIASLKIRFNKIFGYSIEVSKANLHLVPERFQRKQTIAGGERYVTQELKEYEVKVLHAQERIEEIEFDAFCRVRAEVGTQAPRLKATARALATLDVLAAFADLAARRGWRRPAVDDGTTLEIRAGRHPVVERTLGEGRFVPNDTDLDAAGAALAILTGPNMGGKSTYLRQVGLIVLLAQSGSFVPADHARLGIADRIFCRVGASDSLAEGQSTFMVEMTETANILHHASGRSLVLLDEIGRGTSTFDGLAIAWAVAEHLSSRAGGAPRTLFATHYHEMTELAVLASGVINLRMAVKEMGERVIFTHRVESGAADRSYGIHVARLAGIPAPVIVRAREILANLEKDEFGGDGLPRRARRPGKTARRAEQPLFAAMTAAPLPPEPADPAAVEILAELRRQNPDRLTPLEALQLLAGWSVRLKSPADGGV